MGPKHNLVHFKSLSGCFLIKSWSSSQHLHAGKNMKGNPISTFPPCSSYHIGEVIYTWLVRLMGWDLGSSRILELEVCHILIIIYYATRFKVKIWLDHLIIQKKCPINIWNVWIEKIIKYICYFKYIFIYSPFSPMWVILCFFRLRDREKDFPHSK